VGMHPKRLNEPKRYVERTAGLINPPFAPTPCHLSLLYVTHALTIDVNYIPPPVSCHANYSLLTYEYAQSTVVLLEESDCTRKCPAKIESAAT
jgi:hypothetical protein